MAQKMAALKRRGVFVHALCIYSYFILIPSENYFILIPSEKY